MLPHCQRFLFLISYDHLCIHSCWRDSQLEHTCNLQEGAFLPYFSMKIPSNCPVTTYKFLVWKCRNNRNEPKWNLWDAHHRKLTRASSFAMFCLICFTVVTCCYHPGRSSESRSERLGRCGQFHVQLGLQVHCQTAQKETRCDFQLQEKNIENRVVSQCLAFHGATALDVAILRWYCRMLPHCHWFTSYALMISYDHLCIRSCWDSQLEHTCNLQEGAFLPYFSIKIPSNCPVTTYKFLVRKCRNNRNEPKWKLWDAHHRKLTRASSFAMFCLIRFTVVVTIQEEVRVRNQDRKGSTVVVNFMSSWVCECIVRLLRSRRVVTFNCRQKRTESSSWFLSAWRFMVRQP